MTQQDMKSLHEIEITQAKRKYNAALESWL